MSNNFYVETPQENDLRRVARASSETIYELARQGESKAVEGQLMLDMCSYLLEYAVEINGIKRDCAMLFFKNSTLAKTEMTNPVIQKSRPI